MTKADKEGQRKAPILRFKGFTDDWEQRKLLKVCKKEDNKRIPIKEQERKEGNTPYFGANGIQGYIDGYTHDGTNILIAEDGANNVKNYPIKLITGKIWVNNHAHVLNVNTKTNNGNFLVGAIKKINFYRYLVGSSRYKLTAESLSQVKIEITEQSEQEKIGELFKSIEELLTLYERKLQLNLKLYAELLKQFIPDKNSKSILNKINWQSISLGKIAHLQKGKQKNRNDISEVRNDKENYPVYNGGKEKSGYTDEYNRNDSIIISEGGNSAGYVNYIAGKFYSGGHNYSIEPQNIDSSLLYLILLRNQSRIMNLRTGSGLPNIKISSLKSFKIFIPSKNDNLYDFDKLLILFTKDNNLTKDKLNKLKLIKKTLLNTMFI